jgi:hypothetical protein
MNAIFIIPILEIEVGSADYVASRLINMIIAHLSITTSVCVESRGRAATLSCLDYCGCDFVPGSPPEVRNSKPEGER